MTYPTYSFSAEGSIVEDSDFIPVPTLRPDSELDPIEPAIKPTDVPVEMYDISVLSDGITYLASEAASSAGYISSTILDSFDRVVEQLEYDYYCAYRTGSDSYAAVLYLSDSFDIVNNTLNFDDAYRVELYRTSTGSGYNYEYYYSSSSAGDVDIIIDSDLMYYTNCLPGYPALGSVESPKNYDKSSTFVICLLLIIAFLLLRRSRRD